MDRMPGADLSRRQLLAMASMTVLACVLFVVMLVSFEPSPVLWLCSALMLGSAVAFWVGYAVQRGRNR
ncbi:twin-arginine translocation signal domain-containing protein [Prauserella cavernicola]|uniref:Twin-arginine translocation signal domain-containing protein n=1 Tax=Prauserella cavernicola TaxID=2800127 RepID=A0A934QNT0_9PSEU|nr:twin-arginine translocation signal domain-containing protein [Prauserella cavernicola]MBK1782753.1 twin-arginine translocation signal domain-containing protein [Prauserella cavernicola]